MSFRNLGLLLVIVDFLLLFSAGQTTHIVTVGLLGSFYDPPTLLTSVNDTVTFVFAGPFHTVTQSSLGTPCVPLEGGFNSGVVGRGTNDINAPTPTWAIRITNVSEPIWYFCEISTPTSHCESGMVGVINPPNNQAYMQFQSAAKAVIGTPTPSPSLVLSGIGAVATQGPVTPSSTPSPPAPSNPSPTHSGSHLGTIIGAAVGGALGGILIIAAITWWLVQRKARNAEVDTPTSDDSHFFRYNPGPIRVRRPSEAFVAAKALENSMVTAFPPPARALSPNSTTPLAPNRRTSTTAAPISNKTSNQALDRQPSRQSTLASPALTERPPNINMHALANEVAAVLLRSPPSGGNLSTNTSSGSMLSPTNSSLPPLRMEKTPGLHVIDHSHSSDQDHPPAYRTATGTHADTLKPNRP